VFAESCLYSPVIGAKQVSHQQQAGSVICSVCAGILDKRSNKTGGLHCVLPMKRVIQRVM
jgi:hypothetical protein